MAQRVDIVLVRNSVTLEQILAHYDLLDQLIRKNDNSLVGPCPIHYGTNKTQFHVSLVKNAFHCFGDCKGDPSLHNGGGNLFDFVRKMEQIELSDDPEHRKATRAVALVIAEWFAIGSAPTPWTPVRTPQAAPMQSIAHPAAQAVPPAPPTPEPVVNTPLPFAFKHLDINHAYLKERGFSPDTIQFFGIGYHAGKGIMKGRVVIPIHNAQGELVAYAGRWPGNEPPEGEGKYKLPPGFHKSLEIFNL